jgi:hypothetical protein
MRTLAPIIENPWCLVLAVLIALLILSGAALLARAERIRARVPSMQAATTSPTRRLAAPAPLEALLALHTRLVKARRRLPAGSDEARWLGGFAGRLLATTNEASTRLDALSPAARSNLLEHLALEVEALAGVVNLQLGAAPTGDVDRQALEAQLAALRSALR